MNNPWIEAGLNAKAYFEAYRALCRMRISYSRIIQSELITNSDNYEDMTRADKFWTRNREYWKRKLDESYKREKDYLQGNKGE